MPGGRRVLASLLRRVAGLISLRVPIPILLLPAALLCAPLAQLRRDGAGGCVVASAARWCDARRRGVLVAKVCLLELVLRDALLAVGLCFCGSVRVDGLFGEVVCAAARDD